MSVYVITEVTTTASDLLSKASRIWGSVNTLTMPFDMDSTGNSLRLYPIPYGQERMFGSSLFQYYSNTTYIPTLKLSNKLEDQHTNALQLEHLPYHHLHSIFQAHGGVIL